MKHHSISVRFFSGVILLICFSSGLSPHLVLADDVTGLIFKSEASSAKAANEASSLIETYRNNAAQEAVSAGKIVDSLGKGEKFMGRVSNGRHVPPKQQEALKGIQLPHEGKSKCKGITSPGLEKCRSSLFDSFEAKQATNSVGPTQLLIFVSQSVPANSIKELWNQAQRVGGKLLFRGLVGGSFKETQRYIQDLGIVADIDPTKYEEFGITHVPAFILSRTLVSPARVSPEKKHDKAVGNITLNAFLEQSSSSGDLKKEATALYNKLQGNKS